MTPAEQALSASVAPILCVTSELVESFASRLAANTEVYALTQRLIRLGVLEEGATRINSLSDYLEQGLDAQTLAALLATCRAFPTSDGQRTFASYMAEREVIPESEVLRALSESVDGAMSTVQFAIDNGLAKTDAVMGALSEFSGMPVASRAESDGEPYAENADVARMALTFDAVLWAPKNRPVTLLSESPVMDFVVDALAAGLGSTVEVRLVSPRTGASRRAKASAVGGTDPGPAVAEPPAPEPAAAPTPEPAAPAARFGSAFSIGAQSPAAAPEPAAPAAAPAASGGFGLGFSPNAPAPAASAVGTPPPGFQAAQPAATTSAAPIIPSRPATAVSSPAPALQPAEPRSAPIGVTNRVSQAIMPPRLDPTVTPWLPRGPIAERVRDIIMQAVEQRATDVHFDPFRDYLRVRVRVDGLLHELYRIDNEMRREVIARIKILANLDITERRMAQDGQITMQVGNRALDMRVATLPVKHGERLELRLANMVKLVDDLTTLGLTGSNVDMADAFLTQPHGIVLATGPVGSGKTTSLYSCLSKLDSSSYNIMSIEDPVEVDIEGVNQVNVNYKIGFDFVAGLRGLLRHDPDVILIGEIRDEETARIAIRAAMTGMLVFSSLHTNDAPGAITTLYNFHLPPHLVANGLLGVIAQRLLRKLCDNCSQTYEARDKELQFLFREGEETPASVVLRRGRGCEKCLQSGYLGRTGIFEVLTCTPKIRDMILDECSEREIRDAAISNGMTTLHADARAKVLAGVTSVQEMARVLGH